MKRFFVKLFLLGGLCLAGCHPGGKQEASVSRVFPKVELPAMLSRGEEAARYMMKHYWDPFLDSLRLERVAEDRAKVKGTPADSLILGVDSIDVEAAFGEYAFLLAQLQPLNYPQVYQSARELIHRADRIAQRGDSSFLFRLMTLGEKYFYDPNSPVLNEEVYIPVLEGILAARSLNDLDKMQYDYQLKIAILNRVGSPATDFEYATTSGKGRLYDIKGEYTLLFFNNPECHTCHQILETLKSDPQITRLTQEGRLKLLAIYPDEELDKWRKNKNIYPGDWIYACDPTFALRENNLYGLRAIPSLYLLDKEKKVLLKDAPAEKVIGYLSAMPAH